MVDMAAREKPLRYIKDAIGILNESKASFKVDILEIGCMRGAMTHDIDNELCFGCCDGHSTYLWGRTGKNVVSVDVCSRNLAMAQRMCAGFNNIQFVLSDATDYGSYLRTHMDCAEFRIGLLFLDAWDVETPLSAEKHLEFYEILRPLNNDCLILIDDTDLYYDQEKKEYFADPEGLSGKGRLLIPRLKEDGYEVLFTGRQTLLRKP